MKEMEPLGFESKNSDAMERVDSSCNKRWKGYSYVEEYLEIILFFVLLKMEFLETLTDIWNKYLEWIDFFFHTNWTWSIVAWIAVLVYVVSILIFFPLHRLTLRNVKKAKQNLTTSVDEVIYLLAKAQYSLSEQQALKYDPCFALIKTMFWSWHFEYIDNLDTIKENVKKVEVLLKQRVISDEQRKKIDRQKSRLKFHTFWSKFFGYELNFLTIWIYNLFC